MWSSKERRNLISEPSLTLKIAIGIIRTYEATMKDNTRYKDLCETKDGIIHEIAAKKKRQCRKSGKKKKKKTRKNTELLLFFTSNAENVKAFIILRTVVSQRHTYDKKENIVLKSKKRKPIQNLKKSPYKFHYKQDTKRKNGSAEYRDKTNSETDSETGLLLYTVKENNREEVFVNINCEDSRGEKHEIRMKVDTGVNGNIIPLRIYSRFVSIHVVQPYSSIDVTAAWKKLRFILSVRSDFQIIDSLSIAVHAFVNLVSMSFSVDSTLLPR